MSAGGWRASERARQIRVPARRKRATSRHPRHTSPTVPAGGGVCFVCDPSDGSWRDIRLDGLTMPGTLGWERAVARRGLLDVQRVPFKNTLGLVQARWQARSPVPVATSGAPKAAIVALAASAWSMHMWNKLSQVQVASDDDSVPAFSEPRYGGVYTPKA